MHARNHGCRITDDVVLCGNRAVIIENRCLRLTILVDRGTDIIELLYKPKDINFMWRSPVALHPRSAYLSNTGDSFGNYLDHNSGGWQEILPNGGAECRYKNAVLGMHGEISSTPWAFKVLCDQPDCVQVAFTVQTLRSPFALRKVLTLRGEEASFSLEEVLTNLAQEPMELMWGHQHTLGEPFLCGSCFIQTNARRAFTLPNRDFDTQRIPPGTAFEWPFAITAEGNVLDMSRIPPRNNNTADMLYLTGFPEQAFYQVNNPLAGVAFRMEWEAAMFPYLWMWLVCGGAGGYPWYGRTYNLALEPWTSYSSCGLTGAMENGSSLKLAAGQSRTTAFRICVEEGDYHAAES